MTIIGMTRDIGLLIDNVKMLFVIRQKVGVMTLKNQENF